jgi:hypothetical protein
MGDIKLVGIGLFMMFTVPALVAASDRRHTHDLFHIALALAGIGWSLFTGGKHGLVLALLSGVLILVLLCSTVALTQLRWHRRPFTGGEIKFMTAAALWLTPIAALLAIVGACLMMIVWPFAKKALVGHVSRPNLAPFIIVAVILTTALHNI